MAALPRIELLPSTNLSDTCCHSMLISVLRGLAALQVVAAHVRAQFFPSLKGLPEPTLWYQTLAFFTGFAHQAVIVFFLISGWLVGGSFLNKRGQPDAIRSYAIDRITRLWTVMVPTFVLILAFGILTGAIDPRSLDFSTSNAYSLTAFAGNLTGMQTILVPAFGENFPLWSLANESWYYLLFPLLVLTCTARRRAIAAVLLVLCMLLPVTMVLYFSLWLMGAAFSRIRIECGATTRCVLAAMLVVLSVHFRVNGSTVAIDVSSFGTYLLMSVVLMLLLSSTIVKPAASSRVARPLGKAASFLSNFSFTLYVVHVPVLHMLQWLGEHLFGRTMLRPDHIADLGVYVVMLGIVVGFSYGFYRLFEARTYQVRRSLKRFIAGGKPLRAAPAKP